MKQYIFIVGLFSCFLLGCGPKERYLDEMLLQNGIYYDENTPFTGQLIDRSKLPERTVYTLQNGVYNGLSWQYDAQDRIVLKEYYRKGLLNGVVESFFTDGKTRHLFNYTNGKKSGKQQLFYSSGSLKESLFYVNGISSGNNYRYYADGKLKQFSQYNAKGQRHGVWKKFHPNGLPKEFTTFKHGKIISPVKFFNLKGQLINYTPLR